MDLIFLQHNPSSLYSPNFIRQPKHFFLTTSIPLQNRQTVLNRILISNPIFHSEIYSVSRRTISSKSVMSLRPLTCHIPVIPGLIAILARWCSSYCSSSSGRMGRVPTRLMEPFSTFQNCGNSSKEVFSDKFSDSGLLSAVWENFISNDTGVEVDLKHASVTHLVLGHQFRFSCFRIHVHASEFVHLKGFSVFTDPGLRKEDRAG